jgi:predicted PurR-regulated permease PerM
MGRLSRARRSSSHFQRNRVAQLQPLWIGSHHNVPMEREPVRAREDEFVWNQVAFFLLTLAVLVLSGLVLYPFFTAIVGAIVLGVVLNRPHEWLAGRMNRNLSALLMLIVVIVIVIVPSFFLAQTMGGQVSSLVHALRQPLTQEKIADFFNSHPEIVDRVGNLTNGMDMSQATRNVAAFIGTKFAGLLGRSAVTITRVVIMLVLLFFLFRDCDTALKFARSRLPLRKEESDELLQRCTDTIYATVLGRIVVAGVQGVLSGLAYWVLDVPAPALWGMLTMLTAMIPGFGAVIVWAPVAVYLGLTGHWVKAALLAAWGGGVVSVIDNILYPILVGTRLRSHTAAILLSILGGIVFYGVMGIILGPLTFTVADALLEFWRRRSDAAAGL